MNLTYRFETDDGLPPTWFSRGHLLGWGLAILLLASVFAWPCFAHAQSTSSRGGNDDRLDFEMVPSAGAASCLPNARGRVRIKSGGAVEKMDVEVDGLPPNVEFDLFVIQVPNAPFGLSWYQGDIETNSDGVGHEKFVGRFNTETFIVAPNVAPAPIVHDDGLFPDAALNPNTAPVHTFHLGLWFDSPADAIAAGCAGATTPFNGDHTAGIQVLNTRNFPNDQGPLRQLVP